MPPLGVGHGSVCRPGRCGACSGFTGLFASHSWEPAHRGGVLLWDVPWWAPVLGMLWPCAAHHAEPGLLPLSHPERGKGQGSSLTPGPQGALDTGARGPADWAPWTTGCGDLAACPTPRRERKLREEMAVLEPTVRTPKREPKGVGSCLQLQKGQVGNDGELLGVGLDFNLSRNKEVSVLCRRGWLRAGILPDSSDWVPC